MSLGIGVAGLVGRRPACARLGETRSVRFGNARVEFKRGFLRFVDGYARELG